MAEPLEGDHEIRRARRLARMLDTRFVDPLLGLFVPGLGDALASLVGLEIVRVAIKKKLPPVVIARMLVNLALDAGLGLIPLAGDLVDFGFKANLKNADLLAARHEEKRARSGDWARVLGAGLLALAAIAVPVWLTVLAIRALLE